ncbi:MULTISPECIES: sigma-70 family RNA polymerase sigma factor [unclassified Amycolatopsis]|uniref:sigma-70 family RNA polymerase sigma factor n=1 Tax=unclassified Amycolatopsis TaxID=2618356 RepID=UPI002876E894|nr:MULTISPECIES: sigma-70 family RNA polymerase sigma factor [unclassified Amycolatopsis]MDS0138838.1 sigma-70 family RNA polymerase sigma factor [Amycolatopsis sp. 505]MDS0147332.1 sigma-70 family RNA polymerase sigma factor [Amycolatopsis sp. CM201R]
MEPADDVPDAVLLAALRAGDLDAAGRLYRRHAEPLRRTAGAWARQPAERDDLVAETFARVLTIVRAGGGPHSDLRPYLVVTLRNLAARWSKQRTRVELRATVPEPPGRGADELALLRSNARLVWSAYCTLPGRWRTVLWRTEAEGGTPTEVAPSLGLSPNSVAALAMRAREGLRQAYLQVQVPEPDEPACREPRRRMGAWVRGALPARRADAIAGHIAACPACRRIAGGLDEANRELPGSAARLTG